MVLYWAEGLGPHPMEKPIQPPSSQESKEFDRHHKYRQLTHHITFYAAFFSFIGSGWNYVGVLSTYFLEIKHTINMYWFPLFCLIKKKENEELLKDVKTV